MSVLDKFLQKEKETDYLLVFILEEDRVSTSILKVENNQLSSIGKGQSEINVGLKRYGKYLQIF